MNANKFNDDYLNELLDKSSKKYKNIFLLGDFSIIHQLMISPYTTVEKSEKQLKNIN